MVPTSFVDCRPLEVPFLVPPKLPILGAFGNLGGTKNVKLQFLHSEIFLLASVIIRAAKFFLLTKFIFRNVRLLLRKNIFQLFKDIY